MSTEFDDGIAAAEALVKEFGIEFHELRWFASAHLQESWPKGQGISSSDVNHHLVAMTRGEMHLLRDEAQRLHDRNALVDRLAARSGESRETTLANLQLMFAPKD